MKEKPKVVVKKTLISQSRNVFRKNYFSAVLLLVPLFFTVAIYSRSILYLFIKIFGNEFFDGKHNAQIIKLISQKDFHLLKYISENKDYYLKSSGIFLIRFALDLLLLDGLFTNIYNFAVRYIYFDMVNNGKVGIKEGFKRLYNLFKTKYVRLLKGGLYLNVVVILNYFLFIVPAIIKKINYSFVPFILIDRDMSIKEAFELSKKMTKGYRMSIVGLYLGLLVFKIIADYMMIAQYKGRVINFGGLINLLYIYPCYYIGIALLYKKSLGFAK